MNPVTIMFIVVVVFGIASGSLIIIMFLAVVCAWDPSDIIFIVEIVLGISSGDLVLRRLAANGFT